MGGCVWKRNTIKNITWGSIRCLSAQENVSVCQCEVFLVLASACLYSCIDVVLKPPPPPNPGTSLGCWMPVNLNPGELIRISGEERTPDRVRTNCMLGCIAMPSAPSSCLFALATCQLIWVDGRWGMGTLRHLTTMLNTHTLMQARINAHIDRYGRPIVHLLPFNYQLCQKHLHILKMCVRTCTHVHANRVFTLLSHCSQQCLMRCMTISTEPGQMRCHLWDAH